MKGLFLYSYEPVTLPKQIKHFKEALSDYLSQAAYGFHINKKWKTGRIKGYSAGWKSVDGY